MKVKKIAIHTDEGVQTFECEGYTCTVEKGIKQTPGMKLNWNGLSRGTIRFWSGCEKFDDFWTDAREVVR